MTPAHFADVKLADVWVARAGRTIWIRETVVRLIWVGMFAEVKTRLHVGQE